MSRDAVVRSDNLNSWREIITKDEEGPSPKPEAQSVKLEKKKKIVREWVSD